MRLIHVCMIRAMLINEYFNAHKKYSCTRILYIHIGKWNDVFVQIEFTINTAKPELAVTSIKQPTCVKQPNKMFRNVKFVLIFTSVKQPPALSSHFVCFPCVSA